MFKPKKYKRPTEFDCIGTYKSSYRTSISIDNKNKTMYGVIVDGKEIFGACMKPEDLLVEVTYEVMEISNHKLKYTNIISNQLIGCIKTDEEIIYEHAWEGNGNQTIMGPAYKFYALGAVVK